MKIVNSVITTATSRRPAFGFAAREGLPSLAIALKLSRSPGKMRMRRQDLFRLAVLLQVLALSQPALAHTGEGTVGGLIGGFLHPITGFDHVVAMVAVGLWGAFLREPAIWLLPVVFPLVMVVGGVLGILGAPLPAVETGIACSAIVLGLMVALAVRPPLWVAAVLVGAFAVFHGYAHGTELPEAADPVAFSIGFVIATGLLHLFGISIGLLTRWSWGTGLVRFAGGAISLVGLGFLSGAL